MLANKLIKGDIIGVVAPSNCLTENHKVLLKKFSSKMIELGFEVLLADDIFEKDKFGVSTSEPERRANEINKMFANQKVKVIWSFCGGQSINQILDFLDDDLIRNNPKIVIGKSDSDVLLLALNKITSLVTFTGSDAKLGDNREFDFEYTQKIFLDRFVNSSLDILDSGFDKRKCLRKGIGSGKIVGCNLNSILKLVGTSYEPDFSNSILFLESYKLDIRQLVSKITQLKMVGVFEKCNGIVVGHNFEFETFGYDEVCFEDVVLDLLKEYNFPILKINEFGHFQPHAFLPIGGMIKIDSEELEIKIIEKCLN